MNVPDYILHTSIEVGKTVVSILGPICGAMVGASLLIGWLCSLLGIQDGSLNMCVRWIALVIMLWYFAGYGFSQLKNQTIVQWGLISAIGRGLPSDKNDN